MKLLRPICWVRGHVEEDYDRCENGICFCARCGKFLWVIRG